MKSEQFERRETLRPMGEKAQGSLQIPLSSRLSDSLKAGLRSRGLKRFFKNPLSVTGLFLILFFAFIATFASWLAPTKCALLTPPDPECVDKPLEMPNDGVALIPKPPQAEAWQTFPPDWRLHPFGVIVGGYDLYYGIIWGTRSAFYVGIIVVGFSLLVGILIGSLAGYFGGWVDELLMRFVDILFVFPGFVFAVTLSVLIVQIQHFDILGFKFSLDRLGSAVVAIAVVNWLSYSRLVRGDILSTKEKEFVQAARAAGASHFRVILRHILPNTIYPVLVTASLDIGSIVLNIAAFSFLNLGPPPNYADWGQIISASRSFVTQLDYWYVIIIPSVTITLFVLGWNLLGDAFRDVLDPKLRGRGS